MSEGTEAEPAPAPDASGVDLKSLVMGYSQQMQSTAETLRQRGTTMGQELQAYATNTDQLKAQFEPQMQQVQATMTDMSPAAKATSGNTIKVYIVVAMGLMVATVGHILSMFVAPIIGLLFSGLLAAASAFVLVPMFLVRYTAGQTDNEERQLLVVFGALPMGVLSGCFLSGCYLAYLAPPTVMLPLSVAAVSGFLGAKLAENRPALIGASIGAAVLVELVFGLVTGSLGMSYLLYVLSTAALYAAAMQLILANEQYDVFTQATYLLAAQLALQALLTRITSYSYEDYQQLKASQA